MRSAGQLQVAILAPLQQGTGASAPPPQTNGSGNGSATEAADSAVAEVAPAPAQPKAPAGSKVIRHMDDLFHYMKEVEASDLHLSSGEQPILRVHGNIVRIEDYAVHDHEMLKKALYEILPDRNREEFEADGDTDFAYEIPGTARFRCNFFMDRLGMGAVFRLIPSDVLTVKDLNLPQAMLDLCYLSKGLVVVTGPTGSGKSTTLAALVDFINKNRNDHIITIEDPVEFVHKNIKCLVNQREVHVHTESFKRALRAALREDPDIVLVGEMRDLETIAIAIETAETGHLVFGRCTRRPRLRRLTASSTNSPPTNNRKSA